MRAIGIDVGTTSIKGAVLDLETRRLHALQSLPFPASLPSGSDENDAVAMHEVLETVDALLARLFKEAPNTHDLFFCGQMHGITVLDETYHALAPFVTWRDQRILDQAPSTAGANSSRFEECLSLLTAEEIQGSGNEMRPGLGALSLVALQEEMAFPNGSRVLPVCDAVGAMWSHDEPVLHPTFAASLGAYDLRKDQWSPTILEKWGLDRFLWPKVVVPEEGRAVSPVYTCQRHGRSLRIYPAIGDHQAALLGVGLSEGELSLNVSTGAQMATLSQGFRPGRYQSRPYFDGLGLNTVSHLPAGEMLNALNQMLTETSLLPERLRSNPWPFIHEQVSEVDDTDLEFDLAFSQSAWLSNLTKENLSVGHVFRAAFRKMAEQYQAQAIVLSSSEPWHRLVVSGGLVLRSAGLLQEIQKAFATSLRFAEQGGEDTLQGLVAWARRCLYGESIG